MGSEILEKSYTVDSVYDPLPPIAKIATLEGFIKQMDEIEMSLPAALRLAGNSQRVLATLPTGVRKWIILHASQAPVLG